MDTFTPVRFSIAKRTFYITLSFPDADSFLLQVWDGSHLWEGHLAGDALTDIIPSGMAKAEYFDLLRDAFKEQDLQGKRYTYVIARHATVKADAVLKWSIKLDHNDGETESTEVSIPISLEAQCHLVLVDGERTKKVVQGMTNMLLKNQLATTSECESLNKLNTILKTQRNDTIALLERLQREKRAAEVEMMSKFVLVLNAKKAKIASLRAEIKNLQRNAAASSSAPIKASTSQFDTASHKSETTAAPSLGPSPSSYDPLDAHFESHEVYSLSTPQLTKKKSSDLGKHAKSKGSVLGVPPTAKRPQNILETQQSLGQSLQPSFGKGFSTAKSVPSQGDSQQSKKRDRFADVLSMDDSDEFPLPDPKKWKI